MLISSGDGGSEADRRRLRGLSGLRNVASPTAVETTGFKELGSVTEAATSPVCGVPSVESESIDSAIYSASRIKDSIKPIFLEIPPLSIRFGSGGQPAGDLWQIKNWSIALIQARRHYLAALITQAR